MYLQVFEFSSKSQANDFYWTQSIYFMIKYIQNPKPHNQIYYRGTLCITFSYIALLALHKGCIN
jgi:hypothetical protein